MIHPVLKRDDTSVSKWCVYVCASMCMYMLFSLSLVHMYSVSVCKCITTYVRVEAQHECLHVSVGLGCLGYQFSHITCQKFGKLKKLVKHTDLLWRILSV